MGGSQNAPATVPASVGPPEQSISPPKTSTANMAVHFCRIKSLSMSCGGAGKAVSWQNDPPDSRREGKRCLEGSLWQGFLRISGKADFSFCRPGTLPPLTADGIRSANQQFGCRVRKVSQITFRRAVSAEELPQQASEQIGSGKFTPAVDFFHCLLL